MQDEPQKIRFVDDHWVMAPGGGGVAEVTDGAIYLAIAVRNVGSGLAVLHGWALRDLGPMSGDVPHADTAAFHRLTRDIFVPTGDVGFWQGALRDPQAPEFARAREMIEARTVLQIEIMYGDHEGGQRAITRFALTPHGDRWWAIVSRHWNLDRPQPR
jgi:hypothetical protein